MPEDSQGYLASVSDMMCGLLFLFIITLMVFVINFHEEKIKKETATKALEKIQKDLIDARETRKQLLQDIKKSLQEHGVIVKIDTEKGILRVPEDILFESGQAELQEKGKRSLSILSGILASKLPCYAGQRGDPKPLGCLTNHYKPGRLDAVLIEGHTDNVPVKNSKFKNNWDLSAERSINTYQYIIQVKPNIKKIKNQEGEPLLGVSAYADTRPVIRHIEETDEPLNRRIDLRFILSSPKQAGKNKGA